MLDPQARALLDLMQQRQVPPTHTLAPPEARRLYLERRFFTQPDAPALPEVHEIHAGGVPARLYRPGPGVLPLLVYLHGGGWVIGDLDTHDVLCRQLAQQSGVAVLSVHYRLAPEHPFPAAVDDAVAATRWAQRHAAALGADAARLAVGGDSAGGNLAAVTALALRDAPTPGVPPLAWQLLVYPATDLRFISASHHLNAQGYLLTADTCAYFRGHYMPEGAPLEDWRASPLLAAHHAGLPPALVLTAGFDPLRDEGQQYADALSAAGVPCQLVSFERQIHGFVTMGRVLDEARSAVALCAGALREALAAPA